jgi:hypothetical protein
MYLLRALWFSGARERGAGEHQGGVRGGLVWALLALLELEFIAHALAMLVFMGLAVPTLEGSSFCRHCFA